MLVSQGQNIAALKEVKPFFSGAMESVLALKGRVTHMCEWQHASHNWEYKDRAINLFPWKVPKATQYHEGSDCSLCEKL